MDLHSLNDIPPWDWPEGIDKMLLGILRDGQADQTERLLAAEMAGDFTVINDEIVDALLAIVGNSTYSDSLRAKAAIALGPALEYAYVEEFEDPDEVPISEDKFHAIQESLYQHYMDASTPKEVRRRILEASARAPQDWHQEAIHEAYSSGDESWRLTAVFCMRFVRGFNDQILEALEAKNQDIHYQAVSAAGNWGVSAAWRHILGLVTTEKTDKPLLLAAIDAIASIRPQEAAQILLDLTNSDDEDIVDAAYEAMTITEVLLDEEYDKQDDELF